MECNCEHWQICPVCCPSLFDAWGKLVPPKPCFTDRLEMLRKRFEAMAKRKNERAFYWISSGCADLSRSCEREANVYQKCADELARVLAGETPPCAG